MSAHKKKGGIGTATGIVVGGGRRRRQLISPKTAALVVIIFLVAAGITTVAVRHFVKSDSQKNSNAAIKSPLAPANKADYLAHDNQYADAEQVLDGQISLAKNASAKQVIYMQQASIALNAQKYDDALKYAQSADKVLPTSHSAELLAQVNTAKGDTAAAKQDYQTAINRLDHKSHTYKRDLNEYQTAMEAL